MIVYIIIIVSRPRPGPCNMMTITITINHFLPPLLPLLSFLPLGDNNYPLVGCFASGDSSGEGEGVRLEWRGEERGRDVADRRCSRHPLASGPAANPSQSRRAQRSLIKRAPVSVIGQKSGLPPPPLRCLLRSMGV